MAETTSYVYRRYTVRVQNPDNAYIRIKVTKNQLYRLIHILLQLCTKRNWVVGILPNINLDLTSVLRQFSCQWRTCQTFL